VNSRLGGVVFDLDGTLVDSRADIAAAANYALSRHGLPTLTEAQLGGFVGDGAKNLILRAARFTSNSPGLEPLLATFLDYYANHACIRTTLMPGAGEALDELATLPLALLTNKPRKATDALLVALGIASRFRCVIAGGDLEVIKPDPAPLLEIARRIDVTASSLVMVGDGPQDVECGRNAGALTVGVGGGIAELEQLKASRPDWFIGSLYELPALLRSGRATPRADPASQPANR
jgi:2-phosphoglycolate phosphatase